MPSGSHILCIQSATRRWLSSSAASQWKDLVVLPNASLDEFRNSAFLPSRPVLFPKASFKIFPAVNKWFQPSRHDSNISVLNQNYLRPFGSAVVPLELTTPHSFVRSNAPLAIFLDWADQADPTNEARFYLAQASLDDLPPQLRKDVPIPAQVMSAGRGDVYATNIWMGLPPTYTPLHRDPNPNLFVQLVGSKRVRLLEPNTGRQVFASVQAALGTATSERFRTEEMMKGAEKTLLEKEVWGDTTDERTVSDGYEADLEGGDGLFIPNGWWHSIKGTGQGVTASVREPARRISNHLP